jgi:hypothetical protein
MNRQKLLLIIPFMGLSLLLAGCGSSTDTSSSTSPVQNSSTPGPRGVDNSWIPSGFGSHTDYSFVSPGIAFQIQNAAKNPLQEKEWCGGLESSIFCAFIAVIAHDACSPSGTLQLFDSSGNVMGTALTGDQNSSDPVALSPGQRTVLAYRLSRDVAKWNLTSLTC